MKHARSISTCLAFYSLLLFAYILGTTKVKSVQVEANKKLAQCYEVFGGEVK